MRKGKRKKGRWERQEGRQAYFLYSVTKWRGTRGEVTMGTKIQRTPPVQALKEGLGK